MKTSKDEINEKLAQLSDYTNNINEIVAQLSDYTNNGYRVDVFGSAMDLYEVWKEDHIGELKQSLIDKACKWLKLYSQYESDNIARYIDEKFIDEFRKAMNDYDVKMEIHFFFKK